MASLKITDEQYIADLKKKQVFPLHIHWDGSIPAQYLFELAKSRGIELFLPNKDINGKEISYKTNDEKLIHNPKELQSFMTNLRKYSIIDVFSVATRFMQTKNDLIETAVAHCEYLKSQNCVYAETRFAPQYHIFGGLSIEEVIEHAVEGFQKGKDKTGVDVKLIISIGREITSDESTKIAKSTIDCEKNLQGNIIGIDLACEEQNNPPQKHYPAFKLTFDTPLKRTVHAGEMCDEKTNLQNITESIYLLRANGLGHAISLHKDKGLMETVRSRKIRIESNPVCNNFFFGIKIEDLHLDELVNAGILVTINPDDPAMIPNGDLIHNLYHLGKLYGQNFVDKVIKNSINCAWGLSEDDKKKYLAK